MFTNEVINKTHQTNANNAEQQAPSRSLTPLLYLSPLIGGLRYEGEASGPPQTLLPPAPLQRQPFTHLKRMQVMTTDKPPPEASIPLYISVPLYGGLQYEG